MTELESELRQRRDVQESAASQVAALEDVLKQQRQTVAEVKASAADSAPSFQQTIFWFGLDVIS